MAGSIICTRAVRKWLPSASGVVGVNATRPVRSRSHSRSGSADSRPTAAGLRRTPPRDSRPSAWLGALMVCVFSGIGITSSNGNVVHCCRAGRCKDGIVHAGSRSSACCRTSRYPSSSARCRSSPGCASAASATGRRIRRRVQVDIRAIALQGRHVSRRERPHCSNAAGCRSLPGPRAGDRPTMSAPLAPAPPTWMWAPAFAVGPSCPPIRCPTRRCRCRTCWPSRCRQRCTWPLAVVATGGTSFTPLRKLT